MSVQLWLGYTLMPLWILFYQFCPCSGMGATFTYLPKCTCQRGVYWWVFVDDVGFVVFLQFSL